jgi:hypothetical protein
MRCGWRTLVPALAAALLFGGWPQNLAASQDAPSLEQAQAPPGQPDTQQTPEQLQQLVAPIALYPDSLVAQILAASTFPEQVVEADRWIQAHPDLKGDALAQAVDQQPWDPSVKALTAFPSVLGNMDKNLSWTSSLGDAYCNEEQDVMDAVQVMRRRAQDAGNLQSTPQQTVKTEGSDIEIEPVSPEIIYVPAYDPWIVYGGPIVAWPEWYPIRGSGTTARFCFTEPGSESDCSAGMDGAGIIGDLIGITTTPSITTTDTTLTDGRFITRASTTDAKARVAVISSVVATATAEAPSRSGRY